MTFTHAIVRRPGARLADGITTAALGPPDIDRARRQHDGYIAALEACGLEVIVLPGDDDQPDSVFVEDVALLTPGCAIVTRPGADSRRGETDGWASVLSHHFTDIRRITAPGTLEGGDILEVDGHYYIGLTERTNAEGARQAIAILESVGLGGSTVSVGRLLHLKTGVAYLGGGHMVVADEIVDTAAFADSRHIRVPPSEGYAANCLQINGTVLVAEGFPETAARIAAAGFPVRTVAVGEFRKLDGGLSCLSLRF
jgi:dimethylargininase